MQYESLTKLYYKKALVIETEYNNRFNSALTRHFAINIRQYGRKKSFPAFLCYTEELLAIIEKIYIFYGEIIHITAAVPPVVLHQFSLMCIVDEVQSTNDIEGVRSTRREIKEILDGNSKKSDRHRDIINKYNNLLTAVDIPLFTCEDLRQLYDDFAHDEVVKENPANRLDGKLFRAGFVDVTTPTGKTIHRGLYSEDEILTTMTTALQILHDENIPTLIRLALFHYFFAYIHPFYDGNGRTARFITSYFLRKHFNPVAALRLSVTLKRQQHKYYALFSECDSELNRGDMTIFANGFLQLVADSLEDTVNLLQRKNEQIKKYKRTIDTMALGDDFSFEIYYILLQAALFYGQGVTIKQLMEITGKSRGTIQKRLDDMPKEHLIKIRKNSYYFKLNLLMLKSKTC